MRVMMQYREAGIRIMRLRESNHLSREALAEIAGITAKFLYEIECGRKGFSAMTLSKISEALGVSCDFILFGRSCADGTTEKAIEVIEQFDVSQRRKLQLLLTIVLELCRDSAVLREKSVQ